MDAADPKAQYIEAKRLHVVGQHIEALKLLDALDAAHPNTKNVLLAKAECLRVLGDKAGAAKLCERVLAQVEDARARRILAACAPATQSIAQPSAEPTVHPVAPPVVHLIAPPMPLFKDIAPPPRLRSRRLWITIPFLMLLGLGAIGAAAAFVWRQMNPGETATAYTEEEVAGAEKQRAVTREETIRREEAERAKVAAEEESQRVVARQQPGYEIPESEWNIDPATGGPTWRPGIYRQLPCANSWFEAWQGPRTVDVYIPMAYADNDSQLFPVLAITQPALSPGFKGYESWAERNDVIIVTINTSCNDCGTQNNREAQLAAYDFLTTSGLRAHPQLTITTGTSGGAQMAWIAAYNSPDTIAGVLMVAHGGFRDMLPAPQVRVAFVNGQNDHNASFIAEMIKRLHANGNPIRHETIPGGHIEGPVDVRTRMLDWLLNEALTDLAGSQVTGDGTAEY